VLWQRIVDVAGNTGLVLGPATPGDVGDGLFPDPLQPHLAHDLRIDDRRSHGAGRRAAPVASRAGGAAGGRGAEENVAQRAAAARRAGDLGKDRQPDRQPESEHERQCDGERGEPGPRYEHSARRR
jgi:hypothetical protein